MADKFIIFTSESVHGILAGAKTETRRVVRLNPITQSRVVAVRRDGDEWIAVAQSESGQEAVVERLKCPHGFDGDVLKVREPFYVAEGVQKPYVPEHGVHYGACADGFFDRWTHKIGNTIYYQHPAMFMPEILVRLHVKLNSVRVERLRNIKASGLAAEGCALLGDQKIPARERYHKIWNAINNKWKPKLGAEGRRRFECYPWSAAEAPPKKSGEYYVVDNPFVWVLNFKIYWQDK